MSGTITYLTDINFDESLVSETVPVLVPNGPITTETRQTWLGRFAREIYGIIPAAPDSIIVERFPIDNEYAQRLHITLRVEDRAFTVDAALWLPQNGLEPFPVVLGLDFLGPIGSFYGSGFPIDPDARIQRSIGGRLTDSLRGTTAYRWPAKLITEAGYAVITSCYGSWTPDLETEWQKAGIWPLIRPDAASPQPGAIALWAWAISRLIEVAALLPEIDARNVAVAGHSRLGKAALLAAASDTRIQAALINNSGCLGASLTSRDYGETPSEMRARFPHWTSPNAEPAASGAPELDQHQLLAAIWPRTVYVASASEDFWCDPKGEYLALQAASPLWNIPMPSLQSVWQEGNQLDLGPLGWHLRPGPHDIRPYDWQRFLSFLQGQFPAPDV